MTSVIFRGKSPLFFFFKLFSTTYQYVTNISIKQKPKVYREKNVIKMRTTYLTYNCLPVGATNTKQADVVTLVLPAIRLASAM